MDNSQLVSVIIPIYNSERYLDECLSSICSQTYRNLEIVAVNDGSTDSSIEMLESWTVKDKRLTVFNRLNGGLSAARNSGLSVCHGDVVMFVDSDDVLWSNAIEELQNAKKKSGARIACGLICYNNSQLGNGKGNLQVLAGEKSAEGLLYQTSSIIVSACAQLFDRDLFKGHDYFKEGMYYEDLELIPRLHAFENKIAILNRRIYYYRQHETSYIHKFSPSRFDSLKAVESLRLHVAPMSKQLKKAVDDRLLSASFNAFLLIKNRNEYKEIADIAWSNILKHRCQSFFNTKVRLKNKIGILLSLCGKSIFKSFISD